MDSHVVSLCSALDIIELFRNVGDVSKAHKQIIILLSSANLVIKFCLCFGWRSKAATND